MTQVQPLTYTITSLSDVPNALIAYKPTHVVSLLDKDYAFPHVGTVSHLCLTLLDVSLIGDGTDSTPHQGHITDLLSFANTFTPSSRVLFHCVAGHSRSPAAALICDIAFRLSQGDGAVRALQGATDALKHTFPHCSPNRALLRLADAPLHLNHTLATLPWARQMTL
jgi:predicted protein tyrosine phosphatase